MYGAGRGERCRIDENAVDSPVGIRHGLKPCAWSCVLRHAFRHRVQVLRGVVTGARFCRAGACEFCHHASYCRLHTCPRTRLHACLYTSLHASLRTCLCTCLHMWLFTDAWRGCGVYLSAATAGAYIVVAQIVMAYIVIAHIAMACGVYLSAATAGELRNICVIVAHNICVIIARVPWCCRTPDAGSFGGLAIMTHML